MLFYNVADILTKALPITKKGAPCLLFLTSLLMDIGMTIQELSPSQLKFKKIYDEHGPPTNGFQFLDYATVDKEFPCSD